MPRMANLLEQNVLEFVLFFVLLRAASKKAYSSCPGDGVPITDFRTLLDQMAVAFWNPCDVRVFRQARDQLHRATSRRSDADGVWHEDKACIVLPKLRVALKERNLGPKRRFA